jgi:hypothetical protein
MKSGDSHAEDAKNAKGRGVFDRKILGRKIGNRIISAETRKNAEGGNR